jgi:hypothetical protein
LRRNARRLNTAPRYLVERLTARLEQRRDVTDVRRIEREGVDALAKS